MLKTLVNDKPLKSSKLKIPSLEDLMNDDNSGDTSDAESEEEVVESYMGENQQVTEAQIQEVWLQFAEKMQAAGKDFLYSILHKDILIKGLTIELPLASQIEFEMLGEIKVQLMSFLRVTLKNADLQLETIIVETKREKKLYTDNEKFDFLAAKNPYLKDLKMRLDLDSDL